MSIVHCTRFNRCIGFLFVLLSVLSDARPGLGIDTDSLRPMISLSAVAFPRNRMWFDFRDGSQPLQADSGEKQKPGLPRLYAPITEAKTDAPFFHVALSYRVGDPEEKTVAPSFTEFPWDLVLEIDGFRQEKTDMERRQQEIGTDSIYLSPGIRISAPSGISASLSIGGPVWERYRGTPGVPGLRTFFTVGLEF